MSHSSYLGLISPTSGEPCSLQTSSWKSKLQPMIPDWVGQQMRLLQTLLPQTKKTRMRPLSQWRGAAVNTAPWRHRKLYYSTTFIIPQPLLYSMDEYTTNLISIHQTSETGRNLCGWSSEIKKKTSSVQKLILHQNVPWQLRQQYCGKRWPRFQQCLQLPVQPRSVTPESSRKHRSQVSVRKKKTDTHFKIGTFFYYLKHFFVHLIWKV